MIFDIYRLKSISKLLIVRTIATLRVSIERIDGIATAITMTPSPPSDVNATITTIVINTIVLVICS